MTEQELQRISVAAYERDIIWNNEPPAVPDGNHMLLVEMNAQIHALVAELRRERRATAELLQGLLDNFNDEWVHWDSGPVPKDCEPMNEWYKQFQLDMAGWIERERKARVE